MIRLYLRDIINGHRTQEEWKVHSENTVIQCKTQEEWKIQLSMVINFISSKDSDEILIIRAKSNNIESMIGNETDETIEELFESLLQKIKKDQKKK